MATSISAERAAWYRYCNTRVSTKRRSNIYPYIGARQAARVERAEKAERAERVAVDAAVDAVGADAVGTDAAQRHGARRLATKRGDPGGSVWRVDNPRAC